jgi:hypothetical protein
MNTLSYMEKAFEKVGWFIPPYVQTGFLNNMVSEINGMSEGYSQHDLETLLAQIYSLDHLSAMVCERYPITKHIQDYHQIISEAVITHCLGLNHIATLGLIPAIEGTIKKLAKGLNIKTNQAPQKILKQVVEAYKTEAIQKEIGAFGEIASMMDSFGIFAEKYLFIESSIYALSDKTNRHGIVHGAYCDHDYGHPINFYKSIATIDFLCFVAGFDSGYMPCFAPDYTEKSKKLFKYYCQLSIFSKQAKKHLKGWPQAPNHPQRTNP